MIPPDLLDGVGDEDRDYLEQVFREPQKYLPPRSRRAAMAKRPEEPAEEPESRFARRAKLVGLVGAGALVAGAVVTASLLSGGPRPTAPVTAEDSVPVGFSGAAALGGAAVPEQHHGSGGTTPGHREGTPSAAGGDTTVTTPDTGGLTRESTGPSSSTSSDATSSQNSGESASTTPTTAGNKLAAVKKFYAAIEQSPNTALSLLTPALAGGEAGSLVRAWSAMNAIDVQDVRVQDDGTVLAVAVLHQADGTLVRVTQLFGVTGHDVISEARVLSAVAFA
ncbi:hypothetical protein OG943_41200 [Amycolatopsis sp. NBC_00345]|uniref:hypothetical protein n=1 Tax=Amycolatopsis sp. NBC_00345 TaxID=2975955 RepID=UPI002E274039